MSEQPQKDPADAASGAPTELDLSDAAAISKRRESPDAALTVELKKVSLEAADGQEGRPLPQRTAEAYLGFIIDGRFHVESVIASGGMGVVYKARHRVIDKPVAIKILRPELVDNRDITERFLTEAQAASAVGNEHIVDITDYGELPDGATYIVMEYLEGESLGRRLKRDGDPLLVSEVEHIAQQLAEGLHRAHEAQIIHRDLKPDNVFLITRAKDPNFVKILDFGIAKVQSSQNQETRAGRIFGTPHYMSPEQARGEPLDRRSDIYAFGVMLYQMLSGRLPFDGENPLGILTQHMYVEPMPLCDLCGEKVPIGLEAIVLKCMSKRPDDRYDTLEEVEAELLRLRGLQTPLAVYELLQRKSTPQSLRRSLRKASKKRRTLITPFVLLLSGGLAAFAYWKLPSLPSLPSLSELTSGEPTAIPTQAPAKPQHKTVALVLSPIDAHVYHGQRDLGMMPLNVRIREGQRLELEVRREGYIPQRLAIDGTRDRAFVELTPKPGALPPPTLAAPVRSDEARVISFQDGGVHTIGGPVRLPKPDVQDAGAPQPRPPRLSRPELPAAENPFAEALPELPELPIWERDPVPTPEIGTPAAPPSSTAPPPGPPPRED